MEVAKKRWNIDTFLDAKDFNLDVNVPSKLDFKDINRRAFKFYEEVKKFLREKSGKLLVLHLDGDFGLMYAIAEYFLHGTTIRGLAKVHVVISRFKNQSMEFENFMEIFSY